MGRRPILGWARPKLTEFRPTPADFVPTSAELSSLSTPLWGRLRPNFADVALDWTNFGRRWPDFSQLSTNYVPMLADASQTWTTHRKAWSISGPNQGGLRPHSHRHRPTSGCFRLSILPTSSSVGLNWTDFEQTRAYVGQSWAGVASKSAKFGPTLVQFRPTTGRI